MASIARRNLFHDRIRLAVTLTGIVFSVVLAAIQLGLFLGFQRATSDVIDRSGADLWVVSRGATHLEGSVAFTEQQFFKAKSVPGVEIFHGESGFIPFLERTEILVCLLPLTPETESILDARAFAALPKGAVVINAARGGHVADADLIAALDSGHLAAAQLDVFRQEPLPPEHPFWNHPKIRMTPHNAGITNPDTATHQIADNLRRLRAGLPLVNVVDPARGY